jgi:hypothetical protein
MERPAGVTLVGILIVVFGVLYVGSAIFGLFNADMRVAFGIISLIGILIIGLIYLAVAKGIFNGNNFSRLIVAIVTIVGLLIGLFQLIFISGARWNGLLSMILSLVILGLLYSRRATLFFASH